MTREEAITVLEFDLDQKHNSKSKEALRMAIKALEQTRWIPVIEKLPKGLFVKTLVSCEDYLGLPIVPKVALYDGYEHLWTCEEKVVAWMPLPESYKAESEEV